MVERLVNSDTNRKRIQYVEQCFGTGSQQLQAPGRVLVGEGVLTKMCRKKPKPRQFFLFNDILVYGNILINTSHKKMFNKQHILRLDEVKIQAVPDDDYVELKNGWQIISPSKSFVVYAATPTEKTEWMAHISKCVQDLLTKSGKNSVQDASPVWKPDSATKKCMHCKKVDFTLVQRRHHCRKCGDVVCGACSSNKWLFPQQSSQAQRVCDTCYKELSSAMASVPPTTPLEDSSGESTDEEEAQQIIKASSISSAEEPNTGSTNNTGSNNSTNEPEPTTFYESGNEKGESASAADQQESKGEVVEAAAAASANSGEGKVSEL